MRDVQFERVDAAGFALFDLASGSQVGAAADRRELLGILDEIREEAGSTDLLVVAVDDKGQRIGSWNASNLLADA